VLGSEPVAGREQEPVGAEGRQDQLGGLLPFRRSDFLDGGLGDDVRILTAGQVSVKTY
jgi:hypothetical protein